MEFKHIRDCWCELEKVKTIEEVETLFMLFPRWSGDWSWELNKDNVVVVSNTYYDDFSENYETDERELEDVEVEMEEI